MKKCKWAGDAADEYCKDCNGIQLMFEGQSRSARDCAGYEEGTDDVPEVTNFEESMNEPEEVVEAEQPPVEEPPKKKKAASKKSAAKKKTEEPAEKVKKVEIATDVIFENSTPKSIKVMSGITKQVNETFYKFTFEQENELKPGLTAEQIAAEIEKLWDVANTEVDKQMGVVV